MQIPASNTESRRIARQIELAFDGGAWHGPALWEILAGVDAKIASGTPIRGVHSIWEIVAHLVATQQTILRRLDGDATAINLPHEVEWPAVAQSDAAAWEELLRQLQDGDQVLRKRINSFPDDRLNQPLIRGGSSAYDNFHGYVQHSLYHAAQVGLLKKILRG